MSVNRAVREVINPATGNIVGSIEENTVGEAPDFYLRAQAAFPAWSSLTVGRRLQYLKNLRIYMSANMDEISKTISDSTGKTKVESLVADVMPVLDAILHIEKHALKALGRQKKPTPLLLFGKKSYVEYIPRGVVLVISPWNYPLQLAMIPMLSALAAGNSVILKPSEVTPLVGKLIEDLFLKAGFPQNVVQVAHGGKELGAALVADNPDYIFFTGSVRTGKIIASEAAKKLIPTTLELGGKDPMLVFKDANLERAARGAIWGAFTNSGQVCMSVERLYVEREVYDKFLALLVKEVDKLTQGTHWDDDIGSMTFKGQLDIVKDHLEEALSRGSQMATGKSPSGWDTSKTLFIPPTVLSNVTQDMKVVQEESFGPLLPVIPFDTEEEAIQLANDSIYGLNSSVWTSDLAKAKRVAAKLVAGAVNINDVIITVANHNLPFGGAKHSGWGRYHGDMGLRIFCHEKAVMVDKGRKLTEIPWFPYKGKYPKLKDLFYSYYGETRNWPKFIKSFLALLKSQ